MFGITRMFSPYLMGGFGQEVTTESTITEATVKSWIDDVMKPIADVVKEYYDIQAQQQGVQAQAVVKTASLASISPIYLIAGGLVIWYLFKGVGTKGQRRRKGR